MTHHGVGHIVRTRRCIARPVAARASAHREARWTALDTSDDTGRRSAFIIIWTA
ncbi:hypothetical protein J7373_11470 [Xanthomonas sp. A2111]|uniref:Uncharacterized protein n=1 Tax=Xanthomonas hawaiiensis TaxID=3003247 RepID=A0ABU2I3J0_9XANT|nr:hypothetical protein [Xanthomonas sp. A2111]MBO9828867.1 hypothetical protein [Xanthomonas sp. A2111]MDS9992713.1 hypothetical protein [Xanthomonas sp. A2111]